MHKIILFKPLITEKSIGLAAKGWFTFRVAKKVRKPEIIKAVNDLFKVHVTDIRTANYKKENIRTGRKKLPSTSREWKKAMVKLKKGEKIELFTVEQGQTK